MTDGGEKPWEAAWPTKAEQAEILRAARRRVAGQRELRATPEGKAAAHAAGIARLKQRNEDGMTRPPRSAAEWRAHRAFAIGRGGVNSMGMDLGDIAEALLGQKEQAEAVGQEMAEHEDELRRLLAALGATRERAESTLGTLHALGGADLPGALGEAGTDLRMIVAELEVAISGINAFLGSEIEGLAEAGNRAADRIDEYVSALLRG